MLILLLEMILIAIITFFGIKYFITLAPKLNLLDVPNHRSSHTDSTPRGAGIVFGTVFILFYAVFFMQFFILI
jgi:UDP-GlcNAc:undecaprenyl-phosphate GlcNAc-1-phosphate transferase